MVFLYQVLLHLLVLSLPSSSSVTSLESCNELIEESFESKHRKVLVF